jgi:hypothetical protein
LDVDLLFRRGAVRFKLVPAYQPPELRLPDFEALRKVIDEF